MGVLVVCSELWDPLFSFIHMRYPCAGFGSAAPESPRWLASKGKVAEATEASNKVGLSRITYFQHCAGCSKEILGFVSPRLSSLSW